MMQHLQFVGVNLDELALVFQVHPELAFAVDDREFRSAAEINCSCDGIVGRVNRGCAIAVAIHCKNTFRRGVVNDGVRLFPGFHLRRYHQRGGIEDSHFIRLARREHLGQVLRRAGAPRGDHGDRHRFRDGPGHLQVVACLGAVSVHGREHDFTRAQLLDAPRPSHRFQARRDAAAVDVDFPPGLLVSLSLGLLVSS